MSDRPNIEAAETIEARLRWARDVRTGEIEYAPHGTWAGTEAGSLTVLVPRAAVEALFAPAEPVAVAVRDA